MRNRPLAVILFTFGALACADEGAVDPPLPPPPPPIEEPVPEPRSVSIDTERRTTPPDTAIRNLDSSIRAAQEHYERTRLTSMRTQLLDLLSLRASMTGSYDDFQAMDRLTLEGLEPSSTGEVSARSLLERASYLSAVHRFTEAHELLDRAEAVGASEGALMSARLVLDLALGRDPETLLPIADARVASTDAYGPQVNRAGVLAALGRFVEADQAFVEALASYRDISPFIVAFNAFQRGVMWAESADRPDLARPLYEEAVRRLPQYVVANVHLAELEATDGATDRARSRLRALVEAGVGDPEPSGYLGELGPADAEALVDAARDRYDILLVRHREAFADHGSEFFSGPGADPARGLELALFNLENRQNPRAYVVGIEAARAADDLGRACSLALEAEPVAARHPVLAGLVGEVLLACD